MKVTIESPVCLWDNQIAEVYLRLINAILFSGDEEDLRTGITHLKAETPLDQFFAYGYGSHHLWVHQRLVSDGTRYFDHRLLIAEF